VAIAISSYLSILISDLKELDTNTNYYLKQNHKHAYIFRKIMTTLSDDLLLFGSDKLINVDILIDPLQFHLDLSESFPFMSGASLTFSYFDFEDDNSICMMIDNAIIKSLKDNTSHLECQIDDYQRLFKNIQYVDQLLRLNNALLLHLKKAEYSLTTHGERDDFEYFRIEKNCLLEPSVNIQTPMFTFFIKHDHILLKFKDNAVKMNIKHNSNKNYLNTLEQMFIVLFKNEDLEDALLNKINSIDDLAIILPMMFT